MTIAVDLGRKATKTNKQKIQVKIWISIYMCTHGAGWKLVLEGLQALCSDCRGRQLVPDTDGTREE